MPFAVFRILFRGLNLQRDDEQRISRRRISENIEMSLRDDTDSFNSSDVVSETSTIV